MTLASQGVPLAQQVGPSTIGKVTSSVFGWLPPSLTLLALRAGLAVPFWRSGMTKWDGFLHISDSAKLLFSEEFRLHVFGAEIPYPAPELVATMSGIAELAFPTLLILGLGARYAAFALFCMTAVIQLTVPEGWANFHLPWAAMALAIMTFGPGRIALDYLLGVDRSKTQAF
jgi:putative oxidoreductase